MRRQPRKWGYIIVGIAAFWAIAIVAIVASLQNRGASPTRAADEPKKAEPSKPVASKKADQAKANQLPFEPQQVFDAKGIDVEKVIWHMTHESDTVILFDDRGAVVSTNNLAVMSVTGGQYWQPLRSVLVAKDNVKSVNAMKGMVFATYSQSGLGNRFSIAKAQAVLIDSMRARIADYDPEMEAKAVKGLQKTQKDNHDFPIINPLTGEVMK